MVDEPLDYEGFTPDQREGVLDTLAERINALHAEMLRAVLAADGQKDFRADGMLSMGGWLAYRYNLSPRSAGQWVKAAYALDEMPLLRAQYVAGNVGFEQLMHALSYARPEDDSELAELLPKLSCAQTQAIAQARRKVRARQHDEARRVARFCLRPDREGLGSRISGFLPAEDAAYVDAALSGRAEAAGPDQNGTWGPIDSRMADTLRDLCAEDLAASASTSSHPDASVVVIHAPAEALTRDGKAWDKADWGGNATINGQPIADEVLRRILCDTRIEYSIDTPDGRTVGIGRASRTPPPWLRRRVIARDNRCCRWAGCTWRIRHVHHMQHWTKDGPTNASNLIGVCWYHHHLLHEGGWNANGNADTEITLTSPYGHTVQSHAGPVAA